MWYEYPETWVFLVVGMLISWLIARLVQHNGELKDIRQVLEALSFTDSLTRLLNRRGFMKLFNELFNIDGSEFVLCYIDLNKFKYINDTHGHNAGDNVLVRFSGILDAHKGDNNVIARIGGDEFVVIFRDCSDKSVVDPFIESVKQHCVRAVTVDDGVKIDILFSMGVAAYPIDGRSSNELIVFADRDMYRMKTSSSSQL